MRRSIQAYATFRTGQDANRPARDIGTFYRRIKCRALKDHGAYIKRFSIIRQAQEQARPTGTFGSFYFKRMHGC